MKYSVCGVVETGIQIEKNGRDFYDAVSKQTQNSLIKETFGFLAQEEGRHIKVFSDLFYSGCSNKTAVSSLDDYFVYMRELSKQNVFTQQDKGFELAEKVVNDAAAISRGINFEQESILFYTGMKGIFEKKENKKIDAIISEEHNHLKTLMELRKKLSM